MKISLSEIADLVQGRFVGDPDLMITGVAPFEQAGERDITVAGNARFLKKIDECHATAMIVPKQVEIAQRNLVQVDNPMVAFANVLQWFHPPIQPRDGIHPRAEIGREFKHGRNISIGPQVAIGQQVTVGDQVWLHPGVVIGDRVAIGNDVIIHPNVTISGAHDHRQPGNHSFRHRHRQRWFWICAGWHHISQNSAYRDRANR